MHMNETVREELLDDGVPAKDIGNYDATLDKLEANGVGPADLSDEARHELLSEGVAAGELDEAEADEIEQAYSGDGIGTIGDALDF